MFEIHSSANLFFSISCCSFYSELFYLCIALFQILTKQGFVLNAQVTGDPPLYTKLFDVSDK